jgi:hypothetical protein
MSSDIETTPKGPRLLDVSFSSCSSLFDGADLDQLSQETVSGADEQVTISELNVS